MDSVTQFVLGSAVGIAVSPVKTPKIAFLSGAIATIPDLDIFFRYGDDLTKVVTHRTFSHSLIYLTLFSPFLAIILYKLLKLFSFYRWWLLTWLALVTHTLLDSFTIFGTALFLPFSDVRIMTGALFIIDPLYTAPLLISFLYLMIKRRLPIINGLNLNSWGLILSSCYLCIALVIQQTVVTTNRGFATPTPFNIFTWRVVEFDDIFATEYFINLFGEKSKPLTIRHNQHLFTNKYIKEYNRFSSGFYTLNQVHNSLVLTDMRMGNMQTPVFSFTIAKKDGNNFKTVKPRRNETNITLKDIKYKIK